MRWGREGGGAVVGGEGGGGGEGDIIVILLVLVLVKRCVEGEEDGDMSGWYGQSRGECAKRSGERKASRVGDK